MNTTIIARQSSSRDERDPATQFQHAEAYADRLGWTVVSRYVEKSTSGGRQLERRPGLLAALEDVRSKCADRVLVYHRDRLDRNLEVRRAFVAAVEEAGGEVWTPDGRLTFSTANEKLQQTFLGAMDENYRDVIREKVLKQKQARVEAGCPCTRLPFIGYVSPGGWSRVQVVEADRQHVVRAFEMSADGKSAPEIVSYLREQGHAATHRAVTHMLRNALYCGHIVWGEFRHENAHEAIVSDRLFRRVQARRKPVGRKAILAHLEEPGPSPVDAARMAHVPHSVFEQVWRRGRREAENGHDSDAASFYLSAQSAMARVQARLVAEAHAASGSRESQDTLRLAEHLRGLAEPFADEEVGDVRSQSPMLNLTDRIEAESDPEERERMRAALRAGTEGLRAMFMEMQRQEARTRESA